MNPQTHQAGFVNIIGKPNVGKSTLMNILGCLDTPTNGSYLFNSVDITHLDFMQPKDIIAHRYSLSPDQRLFFICDASSSIECVVESSTVMP